jgi:hypothetical protein
MNVYKTILSVNSEISKNEIIEIINNCAIRNGYIIETNQTNGHQFYLKYNPLNIDIKRLHSISSLPYLTFEFHMNDKELCINICYNFITFFTTLIITSILIFICFQTYFETNIQQLIPLTLLLINLISKAFQIIKAIKFKNKILQELRFI